MDNSAAAKHVLCFVITPGYATTCVVISKKYGTMRIVEDTIRKKHISEAEMVVLTKVQSTGKRWLSPLGQEMHVTCKHLILYDEHVRALAKKRVLHAPR